MVRAGSPLRDKSGGQAQSAVPTGDRPTGSRRASRVLPVTGVVLPGRCAARHRLLVVLTPLAARGVVSGQHGAFYHDKGADEEKLEEEVRDTDEHQSCPERNH